MIEDAVTRAIICLLQDDLPLKSRPFQDLAQDLDISEQEIVARVGILQKQGILRRWGAVLRHRQAGYIANAMVAWKVEPEQADTAGQIMAGFNEISHCYLREVSETFAYNLYTMVHARSDEELAELVASAAARSGLQEYLLIRSRKEFKKASMKYV